MARLTPLSGFPEWLPPQRVVEQHVLDSLRRTFELHGFASVETRSVEPLPQLLRKGETDKEVYVVRRLAEFGTPLAAAEDGSGAAPAEPAALAEVADALGLHFDLTVPLARYVLEHGGRLTFPFKRYQVQKVWRGERPQEGRFREFTQADIDVVGSGSLGRHHEVDLPLVMIEALRSLDLGEVLVRVNDRALAEALYRGLGLADVPAVLAAVDKLAKIGPEAVAALLCQTAGATQAQATAVLELAGSHPDVGAAVGAAAARHGIESAELTGALDRLAILVATAEQVAPGALVADLSIARGLDYYTGTVYETELVGHADLGSVCSGGRYDNLVSDGAAQYPGVGLSIGVSRLLSRVLGDGGVRASRAVPTCVLVAVDHEETRHRSDAVARALRARGIPADTAPSAAKYGRQIRHADRLGVPFVWFCGADGRDDEVKDIRSGQQEPAHAERWSPPERDRLPTVGRS